ncbi:MAG: hypothetical protein NVS3B3_16750 [Aquirhabdus sp.]
MIQKTTMAAAVAFSTSMLLVACGGSNGDNNGAVISSGPTTGTLQGTPTTTASLTALQFHGALQGSPSGQKLEAAAGVPKCDISVSHINYTTTGAAGESTTASGAVMVPSGSDPACSGKRPVVLYAHGTTTSKGFNMAALVDPTNDAKGESTLVAATFAAQGYIVIAPNYAGYDTSTLTYHPYVNYKQQSQEMIDALKAGRAALPVAVDSGKLFVTGYSEGGYVAMAALKAMDAAHISGTAGAPMSGPYALAAYGDAIFYGNTPIGGTIFAPLLTTGYQKAYGNIYGVTSDAYTPTFAANIDTLLPTSLTTTQLFTAGKLPQTALFQSAPTGAGAQIDALSPANPKFSFGFAASNYLINTSYRAAYLADAKANPDGAVPALTASPLPATAPANTLRQAFKLNDLRGYIPSMPVLMCGGNQDPTVFFAPNTQLMAGIMGNVAAAGAPVVFAMLDVDATNAAKVGFSSVGLSATAKGTMTVASQQLQTGFAQSLQAVAASVPPAQAAAAVASSYHGTLVPPVCTIAARTFFQQY